MMAGVIATHRARPCAGNVSSGDAVLSVFADDAVVIGVIDGLGHGPLAHDAAVRAHDAATAAIDKGARDPCALLTAMHEALRGSRGAGASVVVVDKDSVTAAGVGNVAVRSVGLTLSVALKAGILGTRMPRLQSFSSPRAPSRVAVFSDGLSSRLSLADVAHKDAEQAADALFSTHAGTHDDASVIVVDIDR